MSLALSKEELTGVLDPSTYPLGTLLQGGPLAVLNEVITFITPKSRSYNPSDPFIFGHF